MDTQSNEIVIQAISQPGLSLVLNDTQAKFSTRLNSLVLKDTQSNEIATQEISQPCLSLVLAYTQAKS